MDKILLKIIDLIKTSLGLKSNPNLISSQSRVSCEAILKEVYKKEIGPLPDRIMFDKLFKSIVKDSPKVIPVSIQSLIGTIQIYGNLAAHPQDNLEQLTKNHAVMVESALSGICNWFFNEYHQFGIDINSFQIAENNSQNAILNNYRDLLKGAFDDEILELDEYEFLIATKKNMEIDYFEAEKIEKTLAKEMLGIDIQSLRDVLSSIDLNSFDKYDKRKDEFPEWTLDAIKLINNSNNPEWQTYLHKFFPSINSKNIPYSSPVLPILGAWQGWYFQFSAKTYFDLFFIAKSSSEIIGVSIEPINPEWERTQLSSDHLLYANISGHLSDEILFNYKKEYIGSHNTAISYEGVIIDDGNYFEGEWSLGSHIGQFNAMKSKSLLPVLIFNTDEGIPIVKTQFLNNLKKIISSWFVQFRGKSNEFVIIHLLKLEDKIHANLVLSLNNSVEILYYTGDHYEFDQNQVNITLVDNGELNPKNRISLIIDWTNKSISGTVRDEKYKVRSLRGIKF